MKGVKGSRTVYQYQCPTCDQPFSSHVPGRKFCSVKCRARSPDFVAVAKRNAEKARAAKAQREQATRSCEWCHKSFACQPSRTQRFCSRICYRSWRAMIFDSQVGALEGVPRLNNFDEFLDRDMLDCPLCGWEGEDLSHHLNFAHGVRAADFKLRAGFNARTGLIGRKLQARLSDRIRDLVPLSPSTRGRGPKEHKPRPEAIENYEKSVELKRCAKEAA